MKSSVGVTVCAVAVLICSALTLLGSAGMTYALLGPMSGQLFDPAVLPPGADIRMLRGAVLTGIFMVSAFGGLGIATGIGLIRLWKWARFAAIGLGLLVIVFTLLPGIAFFFVNIPPPPSSNGAAVPVGFRYFMSGFYLFWAVLAGVFVYMMARKSTVAQFNGDVAVSSPRVRPLSVTIIAWYMIISVVMGLPMMAFTHMPGFVLGLTMTGGVAKAFYIVYFSLYALLGIGLLKRTSEALMPSVGFHLFAMANALVMVVPAVWLRYEQAMRSAGMFGLDPSAPVPPASRYFGVVSGVILPAVIIFFLLRARRTSAPATDQ